MVFLLVFDQYHSFRSPLININITIFAYQYFLIITLCTSWCLRSSSRTKGQNSRIKLKVLVNQSVIGQLCICCVYYSPFCSFSIHLLFSGKEGAKLNQSHGSEREDSLPEVHFNKTLPLFTKCLNNVLERKVSSTNGFSVNSLYRQRCQENKLRYLPVMAQLLFSNEQKYCYDLS